ncbi:hypothetical protein GUJ93_ZPchr0458g22361 [Zizania palustris]|uniref:Uncharacterized protein n=1 Tax=Zizania palustris TaxID=103762 RepID=A0A8J5RL61_ZIZPA|nr:hypothetical protein GUJ93_ZPchr0458g22361 [Zizania palustris]
MQENRDKNRPVPSGVRRRRERVSLVGRFRRRRGDGAGSSPAACKARLGLSDVAPRGSESNLPRRAGAGGNGVVAQAARKDLSTIEWA